MAWRKRGEGGEEREDREGWRRVVIVGGGMAGISAASRLCESGITDFIILEAEQRLGGRILTRTFGGGAIDIGAQYIHGKEGNPLYELALRLNNVLEDGRSNDNNEDDLHITDNFYTSDGKRVDRQIVKEVNDVIEQILEEGNKFSRENFPNEAGDSIGTFLHRQFYKYLRTSDDDEGVRRMKEGIFNWRLLFEKCENACKSIYEMSLYAWGEYLECGGDDEIEMKHGFKPIIDEILKPIPMENIQLGTVVKEIYWDYGMHPPLTSLPSSPVKLATNPCSDLFRNSCPDLSMNPCPDLSFDLQNGSRKDKQKHCPNPDKKDATRQLAVVTADGSIVYADHMIVTCSLGYLKKHSHSLFKPLLPNDKLTSIHRMGFGTVDKIFLEFPEPFWDKDCEGIQFVWMNDEQFVLSCVENMHHAEYLHHDWYRAIQGFITVAGQPTLLEGWIASDEAQIMETVPDNVVRDVCHELLQRFTGNVNIASPASIIRSRWYRNPYTWGSYTYIKDGCTAQDCKTLAAPLPSPQEPRLLFAGEATHEAYFSTVHGAMLSGQREADRLLHHIHATDDTGRTDDTTGK